MKVSRRDFLKISAGAGAAATFMSTDVLKKAMAVITQNNNPTNLVWIQGQSCTGCTISALSWCGVIPAGVAGLGSDTYTTNLLQVLSHTSTDLEFHPTLMPQAGAYYSTDGETYEAYAGLVADNSGTDNEDQIYVDAIEYLKAVVDSGDKNTYVIVEGAIPYEKWGDNEEQGFCEIGMELDGGQYREGNMWLISEIVRYCEESDGVAAFIGFGNCGAFGGIPAGNPNPTGAKGLQHYLDDVYGTGNHKDVINLTDCPAHPEHLVLTYAAILQDNGGLGNINLDQWNRPKEITLDGTNWYNLYGKPTHDECERIEAFDSGHFATSFADAIDNPKLCLLKLGCRGVTAHTNCSFKGNFTEGAATNGWNPAGVGNWNKDRGNPVESNVNPGSWCVAQGSPCYGCADVSFPDNVFGSGFFRECTHSEMLAAGSLPGDASGASEYEGKGLVCYTCHATSMPRSNKEWIENDGEVGYGSEYGGSGYGY